jgi:glucoamylase
LSRPISTMVQGGTLRVVDNDRFHLVWSVDNWATTNRTESRQVGHPGSYVDVSVAPEQAGSIAFTLFWPRENRWLGRNFEVAILSEPPRQQVAAVRPQA